VAKAATVRDDRFHDVTVQDVVQFPNFVESTTVHHVCQSFRTEKKDLLNDDDEKIGAIVDRSFDRS
jgi:hypothetical protein